LKSELVCDSLCDSPFLSFIVYFQGHREFAGKTFEFAGPDVYTHREVVEFVADLTTLRTDMLNVPFPILAMAADLVNFTIEPFINRDHMHRLTEDNVLKPSNSEDVLNFDAVGIVPASMEDHAFDYMHRYISFRMYPYYHTLLYEADPFPYLSGSALEVTSDWLRGTMTPTRKKRFKLQNNVNCTIRESVAVQC
jgi:hypothetical protein